MTTIFKIQNAPRVDHITTDGTELTQMPFPFFVGRDGKIGRQDVWNGSPLRVVGFQRDLSVQQIDLWWKAAVEDPSRAVGMYLVTADSRGEFSGHLTAVDSVELVDVPA